MPPDLEAVRRVLGRAPADHHAPRRAAVAAILTPDLDLVFMRRAEYEGDPWSGHVAFPGGGVEPTDRDGLAAAVRETEEEVGVRLDEAEWLGELDVLGPQVNPFAIRIEPYVFALRSPPRFRLNGEVQSIHLLSLDALLRGDGRKAFEYDWKGQKMTLACVDFDGVRLWGLTLRIVDDLLHRLDGRGIGLDRIG
jgi:8-oxo-dGTP pyrophosphatase MutT (NUDIX family)